MRDTGAVRHALEAGLPVDDAEVDELLSTYPGDPCAQCGESPCSHSAGPEVM